MKCVFTTGVQSHTTFPLLKAAINSLQQNTSLEPIVIWSSDHFVESNRMIDHIAEANEMVEWLANKGVPIIEHELSFADRIKHFSFQNIVCENKQIEAMYKHYPDYYNQNFIMTESLRIDIPLLFPTDEYVMYADCDLLFLKNIPDMIFKTEPLAAVLRGSFFNNGMMIFNIPKMLECYEDFKRFYINSNYMFKIGNTTTQGAYNTYFNGRVYRLPLEANFHVIWGINDHANIVHYVGPKPSQLKQLLDDKNMDYELMYQSCVFDPEPIKYYIKKWNEYAEENDKIDMSNNK